MQMTVGVLLIIVQDSKMLLLSKANYNVGTFLTFKKQNQVEKGMFEEYVT